MVSNHILSMKNKTILLNRRATIIERMYTAQKCKYDIIKIRKSWRGKCKVVYVQKPKQKYYQLTTIRCVISPHDSHRTKKYTQ